MPKFRDSRPFSALVPLYKITVPHKKWLVSCLLLSVASAAAALVLTSFTQQLVTEAVGGDLTPSTALLFVLVVVASALFGGLSGMASGRLGAYTGRDIKRDVAAKLMNADYRTVQATSSGDAISIMNSDCKQISAFLSSDMFSLVTQLLTAGCAFGYLLMLHPWLGLVTFAYTPIGMFLAGRINRRMNALYPISSEQKGEALTAVEQALASLPVIKSFAMERRMTAKLDVTFERLYETDRRIKFWDALLQPACLSVANTPNLVFMIVGGFLAVEGRLGLGEFIAMTQLLSYIIPPTVMLPFMLNNLNRSAASLQRIHNVLNLPVEEDKTEPPASEPDRGHPSIAVENLAFAFHPAAAVLQGVSFTVQGPGMTAIVGGSGSGKTTLLSLLSGLYRPDQGSIRMNGQETSHLSQSSLSPWFSVVPQDIHLFSASILDNLRVGRDDAKDGELVAAAKAAGVYEFAIQKEQGLDTLIGDGGSAMSGGQAQKLGLARAYLKNAPIWLLDEPTSALDGTSEERLHKLLSEIAATRTVFVAAHRVSTIRLADRILFMQDGTIAGDGTWDELQSNADFMRTILAANAPEGTEGVAV